MKIALIAHDKKKDEIIEIAKKYKDVLSEHELYATGTTGTLVMGETGLKIHRMKSGPLGGDQQIGAMLAGGELDLIIFLRDPLTAQPHEPDVSALLRLLVLNTLFRIHWQFKKPCANLLRIFLAWWYCSIAVCWN